mgnify:CR=1 FL=1
MIPITTSTAATHHHSVTDLFIIIIIIIRRLITGFILLHQTKFIGPHQRLYLAIRTEVMDSYHTVVVIVIIMTMILVCMSISMC